MHLFKKRKENIVYSPLDGKVVQLSAVADPAFSEGLMGNGIALDPKSSQLCSPVDGEVIMLFPTKHAIGIKANCGAEILIHIGIDTVCMNGKGFESFVKNGDKINVGQKIIRFDKELITKEGYSCLTMILLTQKEKYDFRLLSENVKKGEPLFEVYEKEIRD